MMMEGWLQDIDLAPWQWGLYLISALIIGIAKGGVKGLGSLSIPLMALAFGGKASTGLVLPMLLIGDVFAVPYYSRYADWSQLLRLLPWIVAGVLLGTWLGDSIDEQSFRLVLAVIVVFCVLMLLYGEFVGFKKVPDNWVFAGSMGLGAGFTTMVGNLAGAFVNLYFLSLRVPKLQFIGTVAWLFLIVNCIKLPLHALVWETIDRETLTLNVLAAPAIILGFFVGVRLVKYLGESGYRKVIIVLTGLAAVLLFFR